MHQDSGYRKDVLEKEDVSFRAPQAWHRCQAWTLASTFLNAGRS